MLFRSAWEELEDASIVDLTAPPRSTKAPQVVDLTHDDSEGGTETETDDEVDLLDDEPQHVVGLPGWNAADKQDAFELEENGDNEDERDEEDTEDDDEDDDEEDDEEDDDPDKEEEDKEEAKKVAIMNKASEFLELEAEDEASAKQRKRRTRVEKVRAKPRYAPNGTAHPSHCLDPTLSLAPLQPTETLHGITAHQVARAERDFAPHASTHRTIDRSNTKMLSFTAFDRVYFTPAAFSEWNHFIHDAGLLEPARDDRAALVLRAIRGVLSRLHALLGAHNERVPNGSSKQRVGSPRHPVDSVLFTLVAQFTLLVVGLPSACHLFLLSAKLCGDDYNDVPHGVLRPAEGIELDVADSQTRGTALRHCLREAVALLDASGLFGEGAYVVNQLLQPARTKFGFLRSIGAWWVCFRTAFDLAMLQARALVARSRIPRDAKRNAKCAMKWDAERASLRMHKIAFQRLLRQQRVLLVEDGAHGARSLQKQVAKSKAKLVKRLEERAAEKEEVQESSDEEEVGVGQVRRLRRLRRKYRRAEEEDGMAGWDRQSERRKMKHSLYRYEQMMWRVYPSLKKIGRAHV